MCAQKCVICFSRNRKMFSVIDLQWVYLVVPEISQHGAVLTDDRTVCWECRATLNRVERLRRTAARARELLSEVNVVSLSRLATTAVECYQFEPNGECPEEVFKTQQKFQEHETPPHDVWVDSVLYEEKDYAVDKESDENVDSNVQKYSCNVRTPAGELKEPRRKNRKKSLKQKETFSNGNLKEKNVNRIDKVSRNKSNKTVEKRREDSICVPERNPTTGTLDCDKCNAKLKSAEYYRVHYKAHISNQLYQCDVCSKTYNTRRLIILHLKKHKPMKYLCEVCGIPNRTQHTLKIHMHCHAGFEDRQFICDLCPRKFAMADKLKIHKLRHTGVKSFKCHLCEYSFYVKFELTNHLQTHHGVEKREKRAQSHRSKSAVMNKPFNSVATPNMRKQNYNNNFSISESGMNCDFCGKSFSNRIALKSHRVVHTGDRPYKCEVCGKTFKFHSNVVTHAISVHENKKSHECALCGAKFKLKGNLTVHMKTHTGEKPYSCDICNQRFIRRRNLNSHYRVHMKV